MKTISWLAEMLARWSWIRFRPTVFLAFLIVIGDLTVQAMGALELPVPESVGRICFPLRVFLIIVSKVLVKGSSLPNKYRRFSRVGFLGGFIVDDAIGVDIILGSLRSASRSPSRLHDLVVKVRSIGQLGTYRYCFLHPMPEDVCTLRAFLSDTYNLTAVFDDLAGTVRVYAGPKNLFCLRELLLLTYQRRAPPLLDVDSNSLLGDYEYADETPMDPSLSGLAV